MGPNGYRLVPKWGAAMGIGTGSKTMLSALAQWQYPMDPMAIDWCPKGCAAKGLGCCTTQCLECGCTMTMSIGAHGYRCGCHWVCCYGAWGNNPLILADQPHNTNCWLPNLGNATMVACGQGEGPQTPKAQPQWPSHVKKS